MMCLPAISVLASKGTMQDTGRLDKIFYYLQATKEFVMKFKCGGEIYFEAYVGRFMTTVMAKQVLFS